MPVPSPHPAEPNSVWERAPEGSHWRRTRGLQQLSVYGGLKLRLNLSPPVLELDQAYKYLRIALK